MPRDNDVCKGGPCKVKDICQRYADYLHNQDRYAMNPIEKDCPMFKHKHYYGN